MTKKEVRVQDQDTAKLLEQRGKLRQEQMNLRFQSATGQLEKSHRVNEVRKDIARLETELSVRRQQTIPAQKGKKAHA